MTFTMMSSPLFNYFSPLCKFLFSARVILNVIFADYHYTTREAMQEGIDNGDFIENAEFSGNMYGTR